MVTRKQFIRQALSATAGSALAGLPFSSTLASAASKDGPYRCFDLHTHAGNFYRRGAFGYTGDDAVTSRVKEMNDNGMAGAFFSMVGDFPLLKLTDKGVEATRAYGKGEGWTEYKRQLKQFRELCAIAPMHAATSANDLGRIKDKLAAFFTCEGGDFLEDPSQLEEMHEDGVRVIQLVHYAQNVLGDLQTHAPVNNGLSDLGRTIVRKMNRLGILVDVAHASFDTVKSVADTASAPFILSHSLLNVGNDSPIAARTISAEHARLVAGSGGVIGAWPSGYNKDFGDFIDNIMRLIDTVGVDHVGLGTDMDSNFKPVLANYGQLPQWTSALLAKGLGQADVTKIAGGNAERIIRKVMGS
jgi:membrane dipeptidase